MFTRVSRFAAAYEAANPSASPEKTMAAVQDHFLQPASFVHTAPHNTEHGFGSQFGATSGQSQTKLSLEKSGTQF